MSKKLKYLVTFKENKHVYYQLVNKHVYLWIRSSLPKNGIEQVPEKVVKQMHKYGFSKEENITLKKIKKNSDRIVTGLGKTFKDKQSLNQFLKNNQLKIKGAFLLEGE